MLSVSVTCFFIILRHRSTWTMCPLWLNSMTIFSTCWLQSWRVICESGESRIQLGKVECVQHACCVSTSLQGEDKLNSYPCLPWSTYPHSESYRWEREARGCLHQSVLRDHD